MMTPTNRIEESPKGAPEEFTPFECLLICFFIQSHSELGGVCDAMYLENNGALTLSNSAEVL